MRRDRQPDIPLRVSIQTKGINVAMRGGRPWMEYDVRQDDRLVEFYQDGELIYTACSGEIFGHEFMMQVLEDVINAAMLLKEGRVSEAKLIGNRFTTAFGVNLDASEHEEGDDQGGSRDQGG